MIRRAFTDHDLEAFGALLSDDVTWGEVGDPRGCRNRSEVLDTLGRLLGTGVGMQITELATGGGGILCGLGLRWPQGHPRAADTQLFQVYIVRKGRISEIRRYDDRDSAALAAGVA